MAASGVRDISIVCELHDNVNCNSVSRPAMIRHDDELHGGQEIG